MNEYDYVTKQCRLWTLNITLNMPTKIICMSKKNKLVTRQEAFDDLKEYFEAGK